MRSRRTSFSRSLKTLSALAASCCLTSSLSWSLLRRYYERVMIWLFTRAIISSTTWPVANGGRHDMVMSVRMNLFIGSSGRPRCLREESESRLDILLLLDPEIPPHLVRCTGAFIRLPETRLVLCSSGFLKRFVQGPGRSYRPEQLAHR